MSAGILLTGASGFVGQALLQACLARQEYMLCPVRQALPESHSLLESREFTGLSADFDWSGWFNDIDCVIHSAARVHVMKENVADPLAAFRDINVAATLNLARQAGHAGVKQFIYLSSIKVNGEMTTQQPFRADDAVAPQDPYAISKYEAEQGLLEIAAETGMAITIIRPPLIYGPGVKANFLSLLKAVKRGLPLPLGAIQNKRSLVYVGNLVSLILCCLRNPAAYNQVFLAADGTDLSSAELVREMARALQRSPRLLSVPPGLLIFAGSLLGKRAALERLCGSLQVDPRKAQRLLGWQAPYSVQQGLAATVAPWLEQTTTNEIYDQA